MLPRPATLRPSPALLPFLIPIASALAGVLLLAPVGAAAGEARCTSRVSFVVTDDGGRVPRRRVECPKPRDPGAERDGVAACREAGFGAACERLASGREAAVELHRAWRARLHREAGPR